MKHQISTSIIINANPSTIWNVFTDFSRYPEWNPFIKSIIGEIQVGKRFQANIGNMTFKPRVIAYKNSEEFTWLGHFLFPGIFDGKHSFILKDNGDGTTTFIQKESFNGLLVGWMKKKLDTEIMDGFNAMNQALKKEIEKCLVQ